MPSARAIRCNLHSLALAPISAPIPIASGRCAPCALRLPPPSAGVPPPWRAAALLRFLPDRSGPRTMLRQRGPLAFVHRAPIAVAFGFRLTRRCTMLRMSASTAAPLRAQTAPHCLAHFAPQCPPLNRRCGSDPPGSPASISRSLVQRQSGFRPAGAGLGFHTRRIVDAGCLVPTVVRV